MFSCLIIDNLPFVIANNYILHHYHELDTSQPYTRNTFLLQIHQYQPSQLLLFFFNEVLFAEQCVHFFVAFGGFGLFAGLLCSVAATVLAVEQPIAEHAGQRFAGGLGPDDEPLL